VLKAVFRYKGKKQNDKVMCSPPNIKVIKGSKMEVVGHVA
jgi:hypothetical protein